MSPHDESKIETEVPLPSVVARKYPDLFSDFACFERQLGFTIHDECKELRAKFKKNFEARKAVELRQQAFRVGEASRTVASHIKEYAHSMLDYVELASRGKAIPDEASGSAQSVFGTKHREVKAARERLGKLVADSVIGGGSNLKNFLKALEIVGDFFDEAKKGDSAIHQKCILAFWNLAKTEGRLPSSAGELGRSVPEGHFGPTLDDSNLGKKLKALGLWPLR